MSVRLFGSLRWGVLGCCVGERLNSCRQQQPVDLIGTTGALFDTLWPRRVSLSSRRPPTVLLLLLPLPCMLRAVFQAERDSERFALYARKAALDERAEEIRQQLKVSVGCVVVQGVNLCRCVRQRSGLAPHINQTLVIHHEAGDMCWRGCWWPAHMRSSCLQGEFSVLGMHGLLRLQGTLLAQFKQEAKSRMAVLHKLKHINAEGTVLLKGRAACEIDTTDELLSTGADGRGLCFVWEQQWVCLWRERLHTAVVRSALVCCGRRV